MKSEIKLYCILLLMGMFCPCWADFTVTKVGDSVVDPTCRAYGILAAFDSFISRVIGLLNQDKIALARCLGGGT